MMTKILSVEDAYPVINELVEQMQPFFDNEFHWSDRLETINKVEAELSPLHAFINLFISYSAQVMNNGHVGYFDNGAHASSQAGCMDDVRSDDDLFQKLKTLATEQVMTFDSPTEMQKLLTILNDIQLEIDEEDYDEDMCTECQGSGKITVDNPDFDPEDDDSDEQIEETCPECMGSCWVEIDNPNKGNLTDACKARCEAADTQLSNIYDKLVISIANRILMDKENG